MPEAKKPKIADVVQVERHGTKIVIPEGMDWPRVIDFATQQMEYEEQKVAIHAPIEGQVFEGAYALYCELQDQFGYANSVASQSMFGEDPPHMLSVPISRDQTIQVPWGRFKIPGVDGYLESGIQRANDGHAGFVIQGEVRRKFEKVVNGIVEGVRKRVREDSLWRGKAFRFRLYAPDGEPLPFPMPEFLSLPLEAEVELTFSAAVQADMEINLWNQIEYREVMRKVGFPSKRGILFAGEYGVGKSLAATVTALKAIRHGFTFIEATSADELGEVVRVARDYQPAIVFCEDIDRVTNGDRSVRLDELLNIIDGVEAKGSDIIIVLTTNDVESIHPSMLRPGRLDAIINVTAPDAEAVDRLMRVYGREQITADTDLSVAAAKLDGQRSAVIREVVDRSKSAWVRSHPDERDLLLTDPTAMRLTSEDMLHAALSMENQLELLKEREKDERSNQEKAAAILAEAVREQPTGLTMAAEAIITRAIGVQTNGDEAIE
jgi:ATPase family protein associated with various cellular activities (AAA)